MENALGHIETLGLGTAIAALDASCKAADVTLIGFEKIIGVAQGVGVNIQIAGEVSAVKAAVEAGVDAGNRVGRVISSNVIPRPHEEVDKLIEKFKISITEDNLLKGKNNKPEKKDIKKEEK
jgi:microcompartment protein CcmL/EutN